MKTKIIWSTTVLTAALLVTAMTSPHRAVKPECQVANEWVEANRNNLPNTLDEISTYPTLYRRKIFAALPPQQQVALWSDHLTRIVESGDIAPEAADLLLAIQSKLPYYMHGGRDEAVALVEQWRTTLGDDLARKASSHSARWTT